MRRAITLVGSIVLVALVVRSLLLATARPAEAEPAWGVNCLSCHGVLATGTLTVLGNDTVADPDESATGAPDRGTLPVVTVLQGQAATITAGLSGLQAGDAYAVELHRLSYPGVVSSGTLRYSPDCDWAYWGSPGKYFTDPAVAHGWGSGPDTLSFEITADSDAAADHYDLVLAVAGKRAADGELFYDEQHLYLQVRTETIFSDSFESGDTSRWSTTTGAKSAGNGPEGRP